MNVLEEEETNTQVGETLKDICEQLEIPLPFKALSTRPIAPQSAAFAARG